MKQKIVIVGAGFAGLSALLGLIKSKLDLEITLISKNPHFEYIPSLHLCLNKPSYKKNITLSLKKYYAKYFVQDEIISLEKNTVIGKKQSYDFDYLIVATGSTTNCYNNKSFEKYGMPIKCIADIDTINKKLSQANSVTVIGGGYTGVEVATALASQTNKKINIVHPANCLLESLHKKVGEHAQNYLLKHRADIYLGEKAQSITKDCTILESGTKITSDIVLLSAGITPCDYFVADTHLKPSLATEYNPCVYMCGDVSQSGILETAHNAMIEGRYVAKHLISKIKNQPLPQQQHRDWHILAVALGRYYGVITFDEDYALPSCLTGFMKWIIEKRIMFEFKHKIRLPV